MQCSRVNSRGCSRGVQQGAIHQGTIISIQNQVVSFTGHFAVVRLVGNFDVDRVFRVVEINDVNVKDQNSRARNEVSYKKRKLTGKRGGLLVHSKCPLNVPECVKLTNSIFAVRQVRRDGNPSLLSYAQSYQGFVHPSDHISHADVSVIGAVSLVADKASVKPQS